MGLSLASSMISEAAGGSADAPTCAGFAVWPRGGGATEGNTVPTGSLSRSAPSWLWKVVTVNNR